MAMFSSILGGVGIFLLGMTLMANSFKALAGDALRRVLSRFTGGIFSAILSGAGITALVQSSSATTLTTIGFVSAGLLSFNQAVGVIFGSNLGTTSTGWVVSLIGLKMSISLVAMPMVGAGVLLNLFSRGRYTALGMAIAGFGLVFVGIDLLREGMGSVTFNPETFAGNSLGNKIALILVGAVMTFVMQSSSAAVVTTLAALHSGTIVLEQAAVLVIGQNVGTTITAAIAAIGGSVPAKRTALAHILFNIITGVVAFAMLPLLISTVTEANKIFGMQDPEVALAAFHTVFNLLGLALLVPVFKPFINLIIKLVPEKGTNLTKHLDPTVANIAPVAVEAVRRTLTDITALILEAAGDLLAKRKPQPAVEKKMEMAGAALLETRRFLSSVRTNSASTREYERHLSALHAMDHMESFIEESGKSEFAGFIPEHECVDRVAALLLQQIGQAVECIKKEKMNNLVHPARDTSASIAEIRRSGRLDILNSTARGEIDPETGLAVIQTVIWLDRLGYHLWRTLAHLAEDGEAGKKAAEEFTED